MKERGGNFRLVWGFCDKNMLAAGILTFNAFNTVLLDRSILAGLFQELHNGVYQGFLIVSCHCVCCERRNVSGNFNSRQSLRKKNEPERKKKILSACGGT
jgi:hypothetical protein